MASANWELLFAWLEASFRPSANAVLSASTNKTVRVPVARPSCSPISTRTVGGPSVVVIAMMRNPPS